MSFSFSVRKKKLGNKSCKFYHDLETSERSKGESQEAIYDFINEHKGFETSKKMLNDMNTLVHYIDANEMKSQRIKALTASDLNHLCRFFFHEHTQEKWRRVRQASNSIFGFQRCLNERKNSFNPVKNNEFEKSRVVLAANRSTSTRRLGD